MVPRCCSIAKDTSHAKREQSARRALVADLICRGFLGLSSRACRESVVALRCQPPKRLRFAGFAALLNALRLHRCAGFVVGERLSAMRQTVGFVGNVHQASAEETSNEALFAGRSLFHIRLRESSQPAVSDM